MNDLVLETKPVGKSEIIFTFPADWDLRKCIKYCEDRNFNAFIIAETIDGENELTCAWSWRLSYLHQFGEWPYE